MIKKREFDDAAGREFEGLEDATIRPGITAFLGGAFAAAAVCGAAAMITRSLWFAGDEPPIRVRGGSLYLDLGGVSATWEPRGIGGTRWKAGGGYRGKEEYDVSIVTSNTGCSQKASLGKTVLIEYTAGNVVRWIKIKAPGMKTLLEASHPLTLTNKGKRLMWDVDGYISKIDVDGTACYFASQAELDHALLTDF